MSAGSDGPGRPPASGTRPLWGPVRGVGERGVGERERVEAPPAAPPEAAVPLVPAPRRPEPPAPDDDVATPPVPWSAVPPPRPPSELPIDVPARPPAAPPPPEPQPPARASRTPVLIAAVLGVVLVLAVMSLVVANRGARPSTTAQPVPSATYAPAAALPATPDAAAEQPTSEQPTAEQVASDSGLVHLAGAAAGQPAAATVLALLDRHFTAINDRDYDTWATTVVPRRARQQPRTSWTQDYATTKDSGVQITGIDDAGSDAVTVELTFVSEQDLAHAPANLQAERICWQSRWPVVSVASGGRLDTPPKGSTTAHAC